MASVNKVILLGNVGQEPEIKDLQNNNKLATFSLATTEYYTDKSGERQSQTEWHKLEVWGSLAGIVEKYVHKGDRIYLEGKIKTEKYTDKDQVERTATKVKVDSIQLLSGNKTETKPSQGSLPEKSEDDLPF